MSLFDDLQKLVVGRPAELPVAQVAEAPKPGSIAERLAAMSAGKPLNVREEAQRAQSGSRFADASAVGASLPQDEPTPERPPLFRGIHKAGPKKKAVDPEKKKNVEKLSLRLLAEMGLDAPPTGNSKIAQAFRRSGVTDGYELKRILKLDRRAADPTLSPDLTEQFKKPEGTMSLWPIQSMAIHEAAQNGGLLAPVGVGWGKTLISLLVGAAMHSKKTVLLVPPQLRAQLMQHDIPALNKHWKLPLGALRVVAYSELSNASSADILDTMKPDLIVADECHNLRHRSAARSKRFLRYMKEHPECRFVGLSGTMTRRSLRDFGHLSELALKAHSPLPHGYAVLNEWAEAIDVSKDPMPPGALLQLCTEEEETAVANNPHDPQAVQKIIRGAFRRRLVETAGVVATEEGAIGTSLVLQGLSPLVPAAVQVALEDLRKRWEIAGEELVDILSVVRVGCQLAGGFYYRWVWPNGVKDMEWLDARKAWHQEVREFLKYNRKGIDSPMLVARAAADGRIESAAWSAWEAVKDRPEPPREAVWIDDYLVKEAVRWGSETCTKAEPGIIWYQHDALGRAIATAGALPFYGPETDGSVAESLAKHDVKKHPVIVASVKAHGTGKNLQAFSRNLFTTPMSGGVEWEQAIARTHRPGQLADEVNVEVYVHTAEMERAFVSALRDAEYIQSTQGGKQKLLYARRLNLPEPE